MKNLLISTSLLILLLGASRQANAVNLLVGFIERPPYIYTNADGAIQGSFGQKVEEIFFNARVNAKLIKFAPSELKTFFGSEKVDGYITTKSIVDNPGDYLFSKKPFVTLKFYAYSLPSTKPVDQVSDLRNTTLTLPLPLDKYKGKLKDWIDDTSNNVSVVGHSMPFDEQIEWLKQGRVKYVITYVDQNTQALQFSKKIDTDQFQVNDLFSLPLYSVVKKSVAHSQEMMQRVNRFVK